MDARRVCHLGMSSRSMINNGKKKMLKYKKGSMGPIILRRILFRNFFFLQFNVDSDFLETHAPHCFGTSYPMISSCILISRLPSLSALPIHYASEAPV